MITPGSICTDGRHGIHTSIHLVVISSWSWPLCLREPSVQAAQIQQQAPANARVPTGSPRRIPSGPIPRSSKTGLIRAYTPVDRSSPLSLAPLDEEDSVPLEAPSALLRPMQANTFQGEEVFHFSTLYYTSLSGTLFLYSSSNATKRTEQGAEIILQSASVL